MSDDARATSGDSTSTGDASSAVRPARELRALSAPALRTILGATTAGVAVHEQASGTILFTNAAYAEPLGFEPAQMIGRTHDELGLLPSADVRAALRARMERDGRLEHVDVTVRPDGRAAHHALVSVSRHDLDGVPCLVTTSLDVTASRETERALRESEARLALAEQLAQLGSVEWSRASGRVQLSDESFEILGLDPRTFDHELEVRQSQKMQAFGQLAAGIAHELNNMLTAIQGNLGLIQLGPTSADELTEITDEIGAATQRAASLTRQLLMFSRRQAPSLHTLDLNTVVAGATKMLSQLIGEHIMLSTHLTREPLHVQADAGMLEQVILNLVTNARDAMPRGGHVTVRTTRLELDATSVDRPRRGVPGSLVRLTVEDDGTGIDPAHVPHLFEPFFTTKEVGQGSGLGLATVFGIVEQHHGWIDVDSVVGRGTRMHVFLPATRSAPLDEKRPTTDDLFTADETILLVEDEMPVRVLARRVLERAGYRVVEADSGPSALALWAERKATIDLLFTDMVMPLGMSGRQLAERLLAERPGLPVLYTSGYSDEILGPDSALRRSARFLEKPYGPKRLLEEVRRCLEQRPRRHRA
ncbi:ATP-binding protein [Myxococcota bacterium]|nr:ATP-binding protein [Myxococcota bacterium]